MLSLATAPLPIDPASFVLDGVRLRARPAPRFGLIVDGVELVGGGSAPADYVDALLLAPARREAFLQLVAGHGLIVCLGAAPGASTHRDVRGRSSRGRLSPGEYFHHDGCAGPDKPRVVEIGCPRQQVPRSTATAIAPFAEVLPAMLRGLPRALRSDDLAAACARADAGEVVVADVDGEGRAEADRLQGLVNRALRRGLSAEGTRAFLRDVDVEAGAYRAPWSMGEHRFICNAGAARTMQHRRAYLAPHDGGVANGHLIKRWPHEELAGQIVCDRGD